MIKIQQILSVMETLCLIVFIILAGIFYMIITLIGVKGNIKSDGTYTEAIKRICKRNGLPHITMHGLRHMFATILIEQSVSLEKISKLMGHKSVATTFEIYCGIMEAKKEIAKTIDSVMDPAIGAVKVRSKGGIVCM